MDPDAIAKKARERIFDRSEADGRVLHASAVEEEIARAIREGMPKQGTWGYGVAMETPETITPEQWIQRLAIEFPQYLSPRYAPNTSWSKPPYGHVFVDASGAWARADKQRKEST